MAKKKRRAETSQKTFENGSSLFTIPSTPPANDMLVVFAHLICGVHPYLDISIVHAILMDVFREPLDSETAYELGRVIVEEALTSTREDNAGGWH
jgi:hypothetical protein